MDEFQISPRFSSHDWRALDQADPGHWPKAADILQDRLRGRFLRFADLCLKHKYSGFVVLSIDSLLAEAIQQFREGITEGSGQSKAMVMRFLEGKRFQPDFDERARDRFYVDIRCGLLHQAEAKGLWLIRRNQTSMLQNIADGQGYIIDVKLFHAAIRSSLDDYTELIVHPGDSSLRANLWTKMDHICSVRTARGALYEANGNST
jgi:hypothetical protein